MAFDPVFLSRIQFAVVGSLHINLPAFTIGPAAWLARRRLGARPVFVLPVIAICMGVLY